MWLLTHVVKRGPTGCHLNCPARSRKILHHCKGWSNPNWAIPHLICDTNNSSPPDKNDHHGFYSRIFMNEEFCFLIIMFACHWNLFMSVQLTLRNGSGNDLAPHRGRNITWTNADVVHWRVHTAPRWRWVNVTSIICIPIGQENDLLHFGDKALSKIWTH